MVGSHCGWEPAAATPLSWNEGDWWSGEMELPLLRSCFDGDESSLSVSSSSSTSSSSPSSSSALPPPPVEIEYKYIVRQGQHAAAWQPERNFSLRLGPIEKGEGEGEGTEEKGDSSFSQQEREQGQGQRERRKRSLESCFLLMPSRVEVGDSWDGAVHRVTPVEVVEVAPRNPREEGAGVEEQALLLLVDPAEAAEGLRSALSAAVSALDERKVPPASKEALEADARVAEAAARASAAATAGLKKTTAATKKKGLLRD